MLIKYELDKKKKIMSLHFKFDGYDRTNEYCMGFDVVTKDAKTRHSVLKHIAAKSWCDNLPMLFECYCEVLDFCGVEIDRHVFEDYRDVLHEKANDYFDNAVSDKWYDKFKHKGGGKFGNLKIWSAAEIGNTIGKLDDLFPESKPNDTH